MCAIYIIITYLLLDALHAMRVASDNATISVGS